MAPPKKPVADEEKEADEEEEEEFEDDTPEEEKFTCRVCKKTVDADEGDDLINVCDNCAAGYDLDKLWDEYDDGKISDAELKTVDLAKYISKKAPKKAAKKK